MKKFTALLIFCCASMALFATSDSTLHLNSISIYEGPSFLKRQDLIFTPLIYDEITFVNPAIRFHHSGKFEHDIYLGFSGFTAQESFEYLDSGEKKSTYPNTFTFVDIDYSLLKNIYRDENLNIYGGGVFANQVDALNYAFGFATYFGYFASFGFNGKIEADYTLDERDKITGQISIPVLSLVARSPYLVNDDEFMINSYSHNGLKTFFAYAFDGRLETVNHFQKIDLEFGYERVLGNKFSIGLNYGFELIHYAPIAQLTSIQNSILIAGKYTFR